MLDDFEINEKDLQLAIQRLDDYGIYWISTSRPYAKKLAAEVNQNGYPQAILFELPPHSDFAIIKEAGFYTVEDLMLMVESRINEKKLH